MMRDRIPFVFLALNALTGCEGRSPAAASAPAAASVAASASASAPASASASPLETYNRGEWNIKRGAGRLVFEAPGKAECGALPPVRPKDFSVYLIHRGSEPETTQYGGLTDGPVCRFAWGLPWLDPPPASCTTLDPKAFDAFYAELRARNPHTIKPKRLEHTSPHRGGFAFVLRWSEGHCHVSDILDSAVEKADEARFDEIVRMLGRAIEGKP